jgi:tRNA (guanine37-N1)-methyltransferase
MTFHIISIFPEAFDSYLNESIIGRAIREKKIKVLFYHPRKYVTGKYRKVWPDGNISAQVDDKPYAGGPGMILRAEPVLKAVEAALKKTKKGGKVKVINFFPSQEKSLRQNMQKKLQRNILTLYLFVDDMKA